ncbi:hypothetical protein CAAN1_02S09186 [[Candida] anglica]|uniref:C2H2-type domain-containing protein n=1 Tax=[Candida] anglica TaxID=148631 RepID=A0ABP0EBT4_9ASCO
MNPSQASDSPNVTANPDLLGLPYKSGWSSEHHANNWSQSPTYGFSGPVEQETTDPSSLGLFTYPNAIAENFSETYQSQVSFPQLSAGSSLAGPGPGPAPGSGPGSRTMIGIPPPGNVPSTSHPVSGSVPATGPPTGQLSQQLPTQLETPTMLYSMPPPYPLGNPNYMVGNQHQFYRADGPTFSANLSNHPQSADLSQPQPQQPHQQPHHYLSAPEGRLPQTFEHNESGSMLDLDLSKPSRALLACPVAGCPWNTEIKAAKISELRKHCFSSHFSKGRLDVSMDPATAHKVSRLLYRCDWPTCGKYFSRSDSLKRHVRVIHHRSANKFNRMLEKVYELPDPINSQTAPETTPGDSYS